MLFGKGLEQTIRRVQMNSPKVQMSKPFYQKAVTLASLVVIFAFADKAAENATKAFHIAADYISNIVEEKVNGSEIELPPAFHDKYDF